MYRDAVEFWSREFVLFVIMGRVFFILFFSRKDRKFWFIGGLMSDKVNS